MKKSVALDDVIDGLEMQNEDVTAYLDCDTGAVVTIEAEIAALSERNEPVEWRDWERERIEILREIENGSQRYVQLPSQQDVHEWDIMRRFCDTVGDDLAERLLRAIRGRGAFRRFKDELDRRGLLDRWFAFRRDALREIAIEWCSENDIPISPHVENSSVGFSGQSMSQALTRVMAIVAFGPPASDNADIV
jgi:hypothetical protein